jgi:hypothetical protein
MIREPEDRRKADPLKVADGKGNPDWACVERGRPGFFYGAAYTAKR